MKRALIVVVAILAVVLLYSYITVSNGAINPLGRLSFVKIENPDMYPGHPHSQLLANYAARKGISMYSGCTFCWKFQLS